jgi:hypothetical protein
MHGCGAVQVLRDEHECMRMSRREAALRRWGNRAGRIAKSIAAVEPEQSTRLSPADWKRITQGDLKENDK